MFFIGCEKDVWIADEPYTDDQDGPTPYYLIPPTQFGEPFIPLSNRLYEESIALGRKLFYDPILSRNNNISCSSCHKQENAFADAGASSKGTHGALTGRNSMPLFNLAWQNSYFWDGRAATLEEQALAPVADTKEMDMTWPEVIHRLSNHAEYPTLFKEAFQVNVIDSTLVSRAIAQFEYSIVSAGSTYDLYFQQTEATLRSWSRDWLTPLQFDGAELFGVHGGGFHCEHCHDVNLPMTTDLMFKNNGLDPFSNVDTAHYIVTGIASDLGAFRNPTMRNIGFTAPYMHDGRFETLDEVLEFYSTGIHVYDAVDAGIQDLAEIGGTGMDLSVYQKKAIIAFLEVFNDSAFLTNPDYTNPFEK